MDKRDLNVKAKSGKGITLIALVISVIVLLILAGVSISAITGDESAMNKAKQAKIKTEAKTEEEQIRLASISAIAKSKNLDGKLTLNDLNSELSKAGLTATSESAGGFKVNGQKAVYHVSEFGDVTLLSGVTVNETSIKLVQGSSITLTANVSTDLQSEVLTWRSDNEAAATVDNTGKVTVLNNATAGATAKIYAKAGDTESANYCTVTVAQKISNVTDVTYLTASGEVDETITINLPENTEEIDHYVLENSNDSQFVSTTNGLTGLKQTTSPVNVLVYGKSGDYITVSVSVTPGTTPSQWVKTSDTQNGSWYSYKKDGTAVNVNPPQLTGKMKAIVYDEATNNETVTGNKWANAMTADGSMWVWIPRFAYRIPANATNTNGHSNAASTIEVAFVKWDSTLQKDVLLNDSDKTNVDADNIIYEKADSTSIAEGAGTTKWLLHPAFSNDASIGGGFGSSSTGGISGLWFAKFETTKNTVNNVDKVSSIPGKTVWVSQKINDQFKNAKSATFDEDTSKVTLNSHMVKNSEWGAVAYLGQSSYGAGTQPDKNGSGIVTGGTTTLANIYKSTGSASQSTTHNAYRSL